MIKNTKEFLSIALRAYDNPMMSSLSEFESDLRRFNHINTLINRYNVDKDESRLRKVLNHIVILSNIFGVTSTVAMLKFKTEATDIIETMMYFLKMVDMVNKLDFQLLEKLEKL